MPDTIRIPNSLAGRFPDNTVAEVVALDRAGYPCGQIAEMTGHTWDDISVLLAEVAALTAWTPAHEVSAHTVPPSLPTPREIAEAARLFRGRGMVAKAREGGGHERQAEGRPHEMVAKARRNRCRLYGG